MTNPQASWLARYRASIRFRLITWGLSLLAAALLLNTAAGSFYARWQIRLAAVELQTEVASTAAHSVESFVSRKLERLDDAGIGMSLSPLGGNGQRLFGLMLLNCAKP